jgi:hypothetical protein
MDLAYLTVNAATHVAFAVVFLFFYLQKRSGFALALTTAWTIQALRIEPLIRQAQGASVNMIEWALGDCLFPIVMWCLIRASDDLSGKASSTRWWRLYIGITCVFALTAHVWGYRVLARLSWLAPDAAFHLSVFIRHLFVMVPGGLIVLWLALALYRFWRSMRLPGALIASIAAVPYALGILAVPFQWWFSFYPSWAHLAWFLQILGLSTGFLILILNLEHDALRKSQENVRRLRGLLPICMSCKKIRDDEGYWREIEVYVRERSDADFSHGLCPHCMQRLLSEYIGENGSKIDKQPRPDPPSE